MEIETLHCFIKAARYRNFTKAAAECHITQTAMSRKISVLEQELGVLLFHRDNRQVALTPAGAEFLARTVTLLEYYDTAVVQTKNVANGFKNSLRIGFGAYEHVLMRDAVKTFCSLYPGTEIICLQFGYKALAEHLADHLIDVMISTDQYLYTIPDVEYSILDEGDWSFVCSEKHELAPYEMVELSQLSRYAFITINDGSYDQIRRAYVPFGLNPYRYYQVNSMNGKLMLVSANLGVATVPGFLKNNIPKDVVMFSTAPGFRPRKFAVSYLKQNKNPDIRHLAKILTDGR